MDRGGHSLQFDQSIAHWPIEMNGGYAMLSPVNFRGYLRWRKNTLPGVRANRFRVKVVCRYTASWMIDYLPVAKQFPNLERRGSPRISLKGTPGK